eukprot:705374_1
MGEHPIAVEPMVLQLAADGGSGQLQLQNLTPARLAFKVRTSDNNAYKVQPVFGFLEPESAASIEVTRSAGAAKEDKLALLYAQADPEETNAQTPFAQAADY